MTAFTEADRRKILESLTQVNFEKKYFFIILSWIFNPIPAGGGGSI